VSTQANGEEDGGARPNETHAALWPGLRPHFGLFALLCLATFFEGFDTQLASLVQPLVRAELGVSVEAVGSALGLSRLGMVAAFFVILLADTLGRRPIFLAGLASYCGFTLATAFATDLLTFTVLQFFASAAMVVELALAYLILSEEIPPAVRGRVNGLFASTAVIGAALPAGLLAPLESMGLSWRGLFVVGALPMLLLPVYWRLIPETRLFEERRSARALERAGGAGLRAGADDATGAVGAWSEFAALARSLWHSSDRRRLLSVGLIWIAINFWSGTALYFFFAYVGDDRGWTAADLALLPLGAVPIGLMGYVVSGFAMDRIGRRRAAVVYLIAATLASAICYRSTHDLTVYLAYFALVGLGGVWTIVTTWTAELFPTAHRATAMGLSNNLIGRLGLVGGPIVSGLLAGALGSYGSALSLLAIVPALAIPLVLGLPETRGVSLEDVEAARTSSRPAD
jgi:putative MFS transporter